MKRRTATKRPKHPRHQADLVHRFGATLPQATAEASARLTAWLAEARPKTVGKSLAMVVRRDQAVGRVLGGIAEAAPYLWGAIAASPARLLRLLGDDPSKSLAALVQKTKAAAAAVPSQPELMRILREMKTEAALLIALADIGGVWGVAQVTAALTKLADTGVGLAVNYLLKDAVR